jgi:transposase InsO family protein
MNEKKLYPIYREEGLSVRRRRGSKRARGSRTLMPVPLRPDQRWSLDFQSETFRACRKFRILAVNDDCCRENLALIADTSISGARVARELDALVRIYGNPACIVSDNGKAFTDRLFGLRKRAATGQHEFDLLCSELGIEHRLTPPMRPQTNGMVERFNGRIEDVLQSHRFHSGDDLEQTLLRYVNLYNSQLPQSALKGRTPIAALKDWERKKPELFRKRVYDHAGCDI